MKQLVAAKAAEIVVVPGPTIDTAPVEAFTVATAGVLLEYVTSPSDPSLFSALFTSSDGVISVTAALAKLGDGVLAETQDEQRVL